MSAYKLNYTLQVTAINTIPSMTVLPASPVVNTGETAKVTAEYYVRAVFVVNRTCEV